MRLLQLNAWTFQRGLRLTVPMRLAQCFPPLHHRGQYGLLE